MAASEAFQTYAAVVNPFQTYASAARNFASYLATTTAVEPEKWQEESAKETDVYDPMDLDSPANTSLSSPNSPPTTVRQSHQDSYAQVVARYNANQKAQNGNSMPTSFQNQPPQDGPHLQQPRAQSKSQASAELSQPGFAYPSIEGHSVLAAKRSLVSQAPLGQSIKCSRSSTPVWTTVVNRRTPAKTDQKRRNAKKKTLRHNSRSQTATTSFEDPKSSTSEFRMSLFTIASSAVDSRTKQAEEAHSWFSSELQRMKVQSPNRYWSGLPHHFDMTFERLPLKLKSLLESEREGIGSGASGVVSEIHCQGIPIARKSILSATRQLFDSIKHEVNAARSLDGHHHIPKILGTVNRRLTSYEYPVQTWILVFPVANCNPNEFLADCQKILGTGMTDGVCETLNAATGMDLSTNARGSRNIAILRQFVKQSMGCLAAGLKYMHSKNIIHNDLKPLNILLRNGQIYITDFGSARDRSNNSRKSTETSPASTPGWTAPEIEEGLEHTPKSTDIYALGCVFTYMISAVYGRTHGCTSALRACPRKRQGDIHDYLQSFAEYPELEGVMGLVQDMLKNDPDQRPFIKEADMRLRALGGEDRIYHHSCCKMSVSPSAPPLAPTPSTIVQPTGLSYADRVRATYLPLEIFQRNGRL